MYTYIWQSEAVHLFSLNYVNITDCIPQMCQLQRASTLPLTDQTAMVSAKCIQCRNKLK